MSTSTATAEGCGASWWSRMADYVELSSPRIAALVLAAAGCAGYVARWGRPDPLSLMHTLLGVLLVAASASALNQWLERSCDAAMERTAARPLAAGRLAAGDALALALAAILIGFVYLWFAVNSRTALLGLLGWAVYVWLYTPLKSRTAFSTLIGALAGAAPVLMGWFATGAAPDLRLAALFAVVFLWQFPHFMAIAWIYRTQYRRAGLKTLAVVDPSGWAAAVQAASAALTLAPVSLVPALFVPGPRAVIYTVAALLLNVGQLACAVAFGLHLTESSARILLRASLIYLPLLLALLVFLFTA